MIIDWFTVIAQIVNFLILVALLRFFLFGRIRTAMRERKEQIAAQLDDAKEKQERAAQELDAYRQENVRLQEQKEQILREAALEAGRKREEYLRQAQDDAGKEMIRQRDILDQKKKDLSERLMLMSIQDSTRIAQRVIGDLAGKDIEAGVVDVFIQRLKGIDPDQRNNLASAVRKRDNTFTVTSSFDPDHAVRHTISETLKEVFSENVAVRFLHSPAMSLGIEVSADGYKVGWNADQFLEDIEEKVSRSIIDTFGQHREREIAHE